MIKNYKQFNESIKDLLVGPTEEEVLDNLLKFTPEKLLIKSCDIGFLKGVKVALEKNSDIVNIKDGYPIKRSSNDGYLDIVKYLVEHGVNIHIGEDTPLRISIQNGHLDIVKYLVEHGADIYVNDKESLMYAKLYKHYDIINYLEKKFKEDFKNKKFNESIKDLLKGPSDEEVLNNFKDLTPNELLDKSIKINFQKGIEVALNNGADRSILDKYNETKKWFVNLITGIEEVKSIKYPESIFWKKNGEVLFEQDFKNNWLKVNHKIWSVFENKYGYNYHDIPSFIENIVEEFLNWRGLEVLNNSEFFYNNWSEV